MTKARSAQRIAKRHPQGRPGGDGHELDNWTGPDAGREARMWHEAVKRMWRPLARERLVPSGASASLAPNLAPYPMPSAPDTAAIITTGRARRRRRMTVLSMAGTAAVTVVALGLSGAFGATGHQPSGAVSHQPTHPALARLSAWTVTILADGNVSVRINQFKDPAGLQGTLRADGVPASVTFISQRNPACHPYPGGTPALGSGPPSPLRTVIVIDPSALPRNAGVQLATNDAATNLRLPVVVYVSPQCTGS